jgi:hypothetical protein
MNLLVQPFGTPIYPHSSWGETNEIINPQNTWGENNNNIYKIKIATGEDKFFCIENLNFVHLRDDIFYFI